MFILSKLVGLLTSPVNMVGLGLAVGTFLLFTRLFRLGRLILTLECVILALVASLPLNQWLIAPLENRFSQPALPSKVSGIVVLGGAIDPVTSAQRGQPNLGSAADRLTALVELGTRFPDAKIIFTGGSGSLTEQRYKEADYVADYLRRIGFDPTRVVFENQSRNTYENALYSLRLARPSPNEEWILVTSAAHMPRSMGVFRKAGWDVIPWPVDYSTGGPQDGGELRFNLQAGLGVLGGALHEWLGLVSYRLLGWSGDFFPAP